MIGRLIDNHSSSWESFLSKLKRTRFLSIQISFLSVVLSCTKESVEPLAPEAPNNKAYIFIEPQSKTGVLWIFCKLNQVN